MVRIPSVQHTETEQHAGATRIRRVLQERLAELQQERELVGRESVSGGAGGDAADRSAHIEAIIRLEDLERRIDDLYERLQALDDLDRRKPRSADGPRLGCTVTVRFADETDSETFVLGSAEQVGGDMAVITPGSPLGSALRNARPGDQVIYRNGRGKNESVTLVDVGF